MDFELSKPQKMLQRSVRDFLSRHCPLDRARELMATSTAHDDELWEQLTDQGWTSLTIPDAYDGLDLGAVEVAAVSEAMGFGCLPGPFLSNLWATELVCATGNAEIGSELLPAVVDGEIRLTVALLEESGSWDPGDVGLVMCPAGEGVEISGAKLFVPDAETADALLVVGLVDGELAVACVPGDAQGVSVEAMPAIDATRKLYRVVFDGVDAGRLLARGEAARTALDKATRLATIAVCAELVGGMQWVLETSVEYARTREQFGRVIGSFQAVQHHCADMLYQLESARSIAYFAAWALSVEDSGAERAVATAKAYCSDAARCVANLGVQVHGGVGFTWEHDLQLFYRRAKSNEILFGDGDHHRRRIADLALDGLERTNDREP